MEDDEVEDSFIPLSSATVLVVDRPAHTYQNPKWSYHDGCHDPDADF